MVDEIFDRDYRASRSELNATLAEGLADLSRTIRRAFEVLVRIEYDAPWAKRSKSARKA